MPSFPALTRPEGGFLGSERASVKVQIYNRLGNALELKTFRPGIAFEVDEQEGPKLTGCSVSNSLGSGGTFSLSLWLPPGVDPAQLIEPDAWVDISFCRGERSWHVFRGLVQEPRINVSVSGNGVTRFEGSISGPSFQHCWQSTRIWFNQVNENRGDKSVFGATISGRLNSPPNINLESVLFGLFREVANTGRANWALPAAMPGRHGSLDEVVAYDQAGFNTRQLPRHVPNGQLAYPDGDVWALATQYMDGSHCELFTDILPAGGTQQLALAPDQEGGLSPANSQMTVVFRDKPFPMVDPQTKGTLGAAGPWFQLPTWTVRWQELRNYSLGTNAQEALNAFMYVGNGASENMNSQSAFRAVLWRLDELRRRGLRNMDVSGPYRPYSPEGFKNRFSASQKQFFEGRRARLRDWFCMGTELRSGRVSFWRSFPQIKVGGRLRIVGDHEEDTLTGYIENVQHQWSPGGAGTTLALTRCYRGSDKAFLARLAQVSRAYVEDPTKARPR